MYPNRVDPNPRRCLLGPRPTPEQLETYLKEWANQPDSQSPGPVGNLLRELFVAGCFLQDTLVAMGYPELDIEPLCFKMGQMAFGRDIWETFDKIHAHAVQTVEKLAKRKEWADTPIHQAVPEPTPLLQSWFKVVKDSVGEEGVFPQHLHRQDSKGGIVVEALALDGSQVFRLTIDRIKNEDVTEMVYGVDMASMDGQGLLYKDFLAVVWYVNGEFYTGVINYQKTSDAQNPAFHDIDWNNNYWNNSLRDYPVSAMRDALTAN